MRLERTLNVKIKVWHIILFALWFYFLPVKAQLVEPVHWSGEQLKDSVRLTAVIDDGWHLTVFAIGDEEQEYEEYSGTYTITLPEALPIKYNACNDQMCTAPEVWNFSPSADSLTDDISSPVDTYNLWLLFLWGLLGGFLAIFTPCVWPVIPMTVSFFLKKGGGLKDAVRYGIAIIIIYVALGLTVTVIFGASALNALATNAVVNILFFLLLVVFALSFFGLFEITLPAGWATKLDNTARATSGFLSIALMAFTLVVVSFSCTGPIIGTLLVEAANYDILAPTMGMLGFAIALALPFSLFAMFPKWLTSLPKSGSWMDSLKVVLAFVELALALKFFSVADLAYGWGLLGRPLFVALWVICFLGITVFLIYKAILNVRKGLVDTSSKIRVSIAVVVALLSLAFSVYLVPGIFGAPVKAIAAFAPPLPIEGQEVFYDYDSGLAYARQEHKPVFLEFTGYGCVNCRKMEAYIFSNEKVKQRLQQYVLITLYVDDRTKTDNTAYPTVGDLNSYIQREYYGSNAQPYYIQLDMDGTMLAQPYSFDINVEHFLEWLKY